MAMATVTATAGVVAKASTTTKGIDGYSNGNCNGNCDCVVDGNMVATTKAYLNVALKAQATATVSLVYVMGRSTISRLCEYVN